MAGVSPEPFTRRDWDRMNARVYELREEAEHRRISDRAAIARRLEAS